MRLPAHLALLSLLAATTARAQDPCVKVLGSPIEYFAKKRHYQSGSSMTSYEIGRLVPGEDAHTNAILEEIRALGGEVTVLRIELKRADEATLKVAQAVDATGAFTVEDDRPRLVVGQSITRELLVHEMTHFRDFMKILAEEKAKGLEGEEAIRSAGERMFSAEGMLATERHAVSRQLRERYRLTGFQPDDPGLIERMAYPEVAVMANRFGLIIQGETPWGFDYLMDRAIWKALLIRELRYRIARDSNDTAAMARARDISTLYREMVDEWLLPIQTPDTIYAAFVQRLPGRLTRAQTSFGFRATGLPSRR